MQSPTADVMQAYLIFQRADSPVRSIRTERPDVLSALQPVSAGAHFNFGRLKRPSRSAQVIFSGGLLS